MRYKGLTKEEVLHYQAIGALIKEAKSGNLQANSILTGIQDSMTKESQLNIGDKLKAIREIVGGSKDIAIAASIAAGVTGGTGAHLIGRAAKRRYGKEKEMLKEIGLYEDAADDLEEELKERRRLRGG